MSDLPPLRPGQGAGVELAPFAPWRGETSEPRVTAAAPGLEIETSGALRLPARGRPQPHAGAEPGNYFLSVTGECLPLKRWVAVRPAE